MHWSDCADAQAGLHLYCSQIQSQVYWRRIGTLRECLGLQFWAWCIQIHTSENPSLQAENLQYPFIQAQKPIALTHLLNKDPAKSHFLN